MIDLDELKISLGELQERVGYQFKDPSLLVKACTHASFVNENRDRCEGHNERLEFLGDAVLGLIVSEFLYQKFPDSPEGELSKFKALLVEAQSCVDYIRHLEIEPYLLLGKGEAQNSGRGHLTILSDYFEAIIAAIYLDGGFEVTKAYFLKTFAPLIEKGIEDPSENGKVALQDLIQKKYKEPPEYRLISEEGPHHDRQFTVAVFVQGEELGRGVGYSKKEAQNNAAKEAIKKYEQS